ncbi:MAG: hypothetical protein ACP5RP_03285 [Candidatus Micrarchaeia archaeon]
MPISSKEHKRLSAHTINEQNPESKEIYKSWKQLHVKDLLSGLKSITPIILLVNIPFAIFSSLLFVFIFGRLRYFFAYSIVYIALSMFVFSYTDALAYDRLYRNRAVNPGYAEILKFGVISGSGIAPAMFALMLIHLIKIFSISAIVASISTIIFLIALALGLAFYIYNIEYSFVQLSLKESKSLNGAMSRSWLMVSNSSPSFVAANFIAYSPFLLAALAYIYIHSIFLVAVLIILADFGKSAWQACLASSYKEESFNEISVAQF